MPARLVRVSVFVGEKACDRGGVRLLDIEGDAWNKALGINDIGREAAEIECKKWNTTLLYGSEIPNGRNSCYMKSNHCSVVVPFGFRPGT